MQFKDQGGKVQVLVYRGYDDAKSQAIVKMVGSFDKYTYKPSAGLLDKLTDAQKDELYAEFEKRRQAAVSLNRQHYVSALASNIRGACDSLESNALLSSEQAAEIWVAVGELVKAMRKAGHERPAKAKAASDNPNQATLID